MEKTYCGKDCTECGSREVLNCPGCYAGPGKRFGGCCEIAKCCIEKGHESCATCTFRSGCGKTLFSKNAPQERVRKQEQKMRKQETLKQQAEFLGHWLWYLVCPVIINNAISVLELIPTFSGLSAVFAAIAMLCNFLYAYVLVKISPVHENFKHAGWIFVVVAIISAIKTFFNEYNDVMFSLIVLLPVAGFNLFGQYLEMTAFGEIMADVEQNLSERWFFIRKWYFLGFAGTLGGLFVMLLIPLLGIIAAFCGLICLLLMCTIRIVALYNTASFFKSYH